MDQSEDHGKEITRRQQQIEITLVKEGIKPAGVFDLLDSNELRDYQYVARQLESIGLKTHIHAIEFVYGSDEERDHIIDFLKSNDGRYTLGKDDNDHSLIKMDGSIIYWNEDSNITLETVKEMMATNQVGELCGYPSCCIEASSEENTKRYSRQLNHRIQTQGIGGIEHLVGISHIPCDVDCEATKKMRYHEHLKRKYPLAYAVCLQDLVVDALHYVRCGENK